MTTVRILLLTLLMATGSVAANSQAPLFEEERAGTTRRAMTVLGGWAITNLAVSGPLWFTAGGATARFHEMNVAWNLVNLGIVGAGFLGERRTATGTLDDALAAQRRLESTLLLNIGLDVAYMAAGWALLERGALIRFLDMKEHEGVDIAMDLADHDVPESAFDRTFDIIVMKLAMKLQ